MKEGNPFGPFWDHFNINFDEYREHSGLLWESVDPWTRDEWQKRFVNTPVALLFFIIVKIW